MSDIKLIEQKFNRLHDLKIKCLNEISLIYNYELSNNKGISHVAHYSASIITRSTSLIKSFELLLNNKIYSTAISLIRLQVDNCLRLYAISLCDPISLLTEVERGISIRDIRDRDGNKMFDGYLISKLDNILPNFKSLYEETCGFIHFSFEHLNLNNRKYIENEQIKTETLIGHEYEISEENKIKYLDYMITATFNLYRLIYSYRYNSQKLENR
ncbi:hypothetical protein [Pedobacter sp.]